MATRTRVNVKLYVYCTSCYFCCFVTQRSRTKLQDQSGQQKDICVKYLIAPWTDISDDNAALFVLQIADITCPTLLLMLLFVAKSDIIGEWRVIWDRQFVYTHTTSRAIERTDPPYLTRSVPYFELKSKQFFVIKVLRLVRSRILLEKLPVP